MKRPGLHGASLALCITLALAVKLMLLMLLWKAFFAAPQTRKMRLPTSQVERHVLAPALAPLMAAPAVPMGGAPSLRTGER